ncbi:MAG: serine/threonine-protein phosphatase [Phycisphaerales bacterium]|nr:serine/threonine-protein phosphatase [Phycisphaerales bacterium]
MPRAQPIPAEFLAQYDADRARVLRRRALWYCILVLALCAFGWGVTLIDLTIPGAFPDSPDTSSADIVFNIIFTLTFGRALVYFARRPRSRAEIVRAFQWVIFCAGFGGAVLIALLRHASWSADSIALHTADDDLAQALASLVTLLFLHSLSSLLVALSPREGLTPILPVLAAFAAWIILISAGSPEQKGLLLALTPAAALPGFAWGWWRYRSFNERFRARAIQRRYAEVTRELSDARRVHEALFPPPITRGPVRLDYHYEPMREIGGDFLFVRPLAFPPSAPSGPLLVVLIDVTGHGIAAALAVNRLHAELERLNRADSVAAPDTVINALNAFTCAALAPQGMFATAFAIRIAPADDHSPTPRVEWAGAGHPPAYLRAADGEVRTLESGAPMLGVIDPTLFSCQTERTALGAGDVILTYTDGAIEAADSNGRELGLAGLRALIAAGPGPNGSFVKALAEAVDRHRAGAPTDDTLIVEVRPVRPDA